MSQVYRFIERLKKKITEESTKLAEHNGRGNAPDFGNYKMQGGKVNGLKLSLNIIDETIKELLKEDNL